MCTHVYLLFTGFAGGWFGVDDRQSQHQQAGRGPHAQPLLGGRLKPDTTVPVPKGFTKSIERLRAGLKAKEEVARFEQQLSRGYVNPKVRGYHMRGIGASCLLVGRLLVQTVQHLIVVVSCCC